MSANHHATQPDPATRKRVVIAGGSGFQGRMLTRMLLDHGYSVVILSRSATPNQVGQWPGVTWRQWDNQTVGDWAADLDGAAAVVNVVGRSVDCRKTPASKRVIIESRLNSVRVLGQAMRQCDAPPPVWVQAGSAHIYGDPLPEDTLVTDDSPLGDCFATEVCTQWEAAFHEALLPEQRGVILRTSFVIGTPGGAMDRLIPLTHLGLGGRVGSGKQYISWIHEHDQARLQLACIKDDRFEGVYLATAPNPVTNAQFMATMRKVWHRPWSPPVPKWAVHVGARLVLNTDPELALFGRRCVPTRLTEQMGFTFEYPTLEPALAEIYQRWRQGGNTADTPSVAA